MQSRMVIVSALVSLLLLIVILLSTNWSNVEDYAHKYGVGSWFLSTSTSHSDTRFAFATYLSGFNETSWEAGYKGGGDQYYDSARIMIYQLLHSPSTRSNPRLPFIALVAADVTEEKRHQLEADGATVIEGAYLTPEWVSRGVGDPRWKNVMVKLNLAAMTEYEKICFIDADTMVYERMDGIFKDPSTRISRTKKQTDQTRDDEAPLPKRYMFAGVPDRGTNHSIPPTQDDYKYLNAGFFCLHPSHEIFDYYISVINIENRFFPVYPEQNMFNYVHRPEGNMPWAHLNWKWNTNGPTYRDLEAGVRSFHSKLWMADADMMWENEDPELHRMWWYQKREMDAYYAGEAHG